MIDASQLTAQSRMSDPGEFGAAVARLEGDVGALSRTIQGLLVHSDWLRCNGLSESRKAESRGTLPVAERLSSLDPLPLDVRRPPASRAPMTCRDFALMLVAFLRSKAVPARLRCGFAAYLSDGWEDHWICEYWDARTGAWRRAHAQLDDVLRAELRIGFDPADLPNAAFLTAGEAWLGVRAHALDPEKFGHGRTTGAWFVRVNVARDHLALNDAETSPWDDWRAARPPQRVTRDVDNPVFDRIATAPEQPHPALSPDWVG